MINERIALVMLDGQVPSALGDRHHTNQYYKSMQAFADASVRLCEEGKFRRLEQFLSVAWKLFKEGNETVRNGIINVYLVKLSRAMDIDQHIRDSVEPLMKRKFRTEYARLHYISGL